MFFLEEDLFIYKANVQKYIYNQQYGNSICNTLLYTNNNAMAGNTSISETYDRIFQRGKEKDMWVSMRCFI